MTVRHTAHRRLAFAAAGIAIALALAGCSSSSTPAKSSSSSGDSSGVATAKAAVAKYTGVVSGFVPSDPITGVDTLAGKTIVYIPAVAAIPFFATSYTALVKSFAVVGMKVTLCDGQANPSTIASCLQQAINTNAAGVIMDALPPVLAQDAFNSVVAKGIPVVLGNIPTPDGSPSTVATVGPDSALATTLAADAIIAKSNGRANVLAVRVIDSPTTSSWMDNGATKEFKTNCPSCTLKVVDTKTADLQNAPSLVSAALLANPSIDYLLPELSPEITPTIKGATDAGKGSLPAASTATALGDLQQLAAGQGLFATVGWDVVRTQWIETDMMMRLILKQPVDASKYVIPLRIFNSDNVKSLDVTQAGWDDSNWFGGTDYQTALTKLWTGK